MSETSVVVVGLADTGVAVATALAAEGARVTVLEDDPTGSDYPAHRSRLIDLGVRVIEHATDQEIDELVDLLTGEPGLVVPSPGVRPNHRVLVRAAIRDVPIRSEIDLAAERLIMPIVAITGTNGKTTTTELVARMLERSHRKVLCGGNIGTPLLSLSQLPADVAVAEVSSFQLHFTTKIWRPRIAVLLNIADDHLDWHGSFEQYAADKAKVFANQGSDDVIVVNDDDDIAARVASGARSRHVGVSSTGRRSGSWSSDGAWLRDDHDEPLVRVSDMPRALPHDIANALCAAAAADAIGAERAAIIDVLTSYVTLPHRVQFIGETGGVRYYDDSKATNPHATSRAVEAFDSVVLLAGGLNKGLDLAALRTGVPPVRAVVAFGAAAEEVEAAFGDICPVTRATTMRDVVRAAAAMARPGDVVLLSPGCASFDMYPGGYAERGRDFVLEVSQLIAESSVQEAR